MDFTLEVEDKVSRDAIYHKLYRPLSNPPNKVWRDSTQTKTTTPPFKIGNPLR